MKNSNGKGLIWSGISLSVLSVLILCTEIYVQARQAFLGGATCIEGGCPPYIVSHTPSFIEADGPVILFAIGILLLTLGLIDRHRTKNNLNK